MLTKINYNSRLVKYIHRSLKTWIKVKQVLNAFWVVASSFCEPWRNVQLASFLIGFDSGTIPPELPMTSEVAVQLHPHRLHSSGQCVQISGMCAPACAVGLYLRVERFPNSGNPFRQPASPFMSVPVILSTRTKSQILRPVVSSVTVYMVNALPHRNLPI